MKFQKKGCATAAREHIKTLLEDEKGHLQGGLRPTDEGYKIIANVIYDELQKLLYQSSTHH